MRLRPCVGVSLCAPSVYGLRHVNKVDGLDHTIPAETSSLAGWALVVVDLDRYPRKGFPLGGVAEVVNDYPKVVVNVVAVIYLALVASRLIFELVHVSHNFKKYN